MARTLTGGGTTSRQAQDGADQEDDPTRRRSRSVSDTLGDFFRPKRKKRKDMFNSDVESSAGAGVGRDNGNGESDGGGSTANPGL